MEITLPYHYQPRQYQLPLLRALDSGIKRACCVWHRRAGKDITLWNYVIKRAMQDIGIYYYLLPEYTQAKKIIWDGIDIDGFKYLDYIPKELLKKQNSQEMKIELINNSIIQLIGTDNYDAIRGTNPRGVVFSESAYQNPMAWEVIRPILEVNDGWAVFNSTPNGKNHFYEIYEYAKNDPKWFCELLSVKDTGVLSAEKIEAIRLEYVARGQGEEMFQQEYYCNWDIGALGAYYSKQINESRQKNRICQVAYDKALDVDLILDLGKNDATSIGFRQQLGKEIRFIDFYENSNEDIAHYVDVLRKKPYRYGTMYLPHDAGHKRLDSERTIEEQFKDAGFTTEIVDKLDINDGIQLVRQQFPRYWFDAENCKQLIRCLENYHREYDHDKKVFKMNPLHDWSSHACDMMRYSAVSVGEDYEEQIYKKKPVFDPYSLI